MLADRVSRTRLWPFLAAGACYSAVTLVLTYPLILNISSALPADGRDASFAAWILWWNAHAVPFTQAWWNAPIFYPISGSLGFSETLLGLTPVTTPIQWLGGSPIVAYNVIFLLSFPLSGIAAHGLVYSLTRRHDAAFIAGLAYAFNPYRIAQLPHIQMLASFWMPVALLGLHAFARARRWRSLVLFITAWLLQGLSNAYFLLFLPVLVGLWLLWFLPPWTNWRPMALVATASAAAAVLLAPLATGYYVIHERFGLSQSFGEIAAAGVHPGSVLNMSPLLWLWHSPFPSLEPEKQLFPGVTVIVLIAAGVVVAMRTGASPLRAYRQQSALGFYVCAAGIMWLLSLGPAPTFRGTTIWAAAPYSWLMALPGFGSLRVPARFAALMMLCLSTAAGLSFVRLVLPQHRYRLTIAAAIVGGILADTWILGTPTFAAPRASDLVNSALPAAPVLELPLGDEQADAMAGLRQSFHHRPVVNGYTSYFPPHYAALTAGLNEHDDDTLTELATHGPIAIVLDDNADPDGAWTRYLTQHAGSRLVRSSGAQTLYWLAHAQRRPRPQVGAPLPIQSLTANSGGDAFRALTDGVVASAWHSGGSQRGAEELIADLGSVQPIRAAELWLGSAVKDFPRELRIDVSQDGNQWDDAWEGHGSAPAFIAALDNPREIRTFYDLGNRSARFVRFRQVARDRRPWSVAELRILPP